MKNCFVNAYIKKPLKKYYMYHGILMECNIAPDPDPLECIDLSETWATHEFKLYSGTFEESGGYDARHIRTEYSDDYTYLQVRDMKESFYTPLTGGLFRIGQGYGYQWWHTWEIYRSQMFIKNTVLLPTFNIITASLVFRVYEKPRDKNFDIVIQRGIEMIGNVPKYSSQPPVLSDFDRTLYDYDGGSKNTLYMGDKNSLFSIHLNGLGYSWINKEVNGIMKFCIRSRDDIDAIPPAQIEDRREQCQLYNGNQKYNYYKSYLSALVAVYTSRSTTGAVTNITSTTATFNGAVIKVGVFVVIYGFEFKKGVDGTIYEAIVGRNLYTQPEVFLKNKEYLLPGEDYYVRAFSENEAGRARGNFVKFTTLD